mgnify:CR=1 FL=1
MPEPLVPTLLSLAIGWAIALPAALELALWLDDDLPVLVGQPAHHEATTRG